MSDGTHRLRPRPWAIAVALLLAGVLVVAGTARAQSSTPWLVPVAGLDGLVPLDTPTLRSMRGGQAGQAPIGPPRLGNAVRLWDEISRPPVPPLPQDGTVSSTSRSSK
jgi:hypothetical protein